MTKKSYALRDESAVINGARANKSAQMTPTEAEYYLACGLVNEPQTKRKPEPKSQPAKEPS
ncbi:hypothetical protein [Polycladidibacter hongkongensis]|uniref:hypothetical protein n=1 Tax=Polycladidibacter hongkongensis TaxID=1647556 RepID=UPI000836FADB|nr:hypothetical protein [Pseudovibrio hongkongensis]